MDCVPEVLTSNNLSLQLVEGYVEVMGNVNRCYKLTRILESACGLIEVSISRQ